ncbi:MAG: sensor domain-containing diguanylate cyclase [Desulfuromonas sp.]|nr:MAG: sensor domain-containing diguanylate cyclase [Desulfuromonas sp.]
MNSDKQKMMAETDRELLGTLQRRNEELSTLVEIGKALTSTLSREDVLNVVMEKVSLLLHSKLWSLLLVDEKTGEMTFEIAVSPAAERLKGLRLKKGEGIAGWVAEHGEPLLIPNVNEDSRFSSQVDEATSYSTKSIICVPLKSKNRILGVIELINSEEEGTFTKNDLPILTTISDYVAIAIENALYFEKINELIITDDLTELYNSRHFNELIDYELERARRYGTFLSIVFFDLDYFKTVNDTHGHLVGSRILSEIGALVKKYTRRVNLAARYGGDEFVMLLPNTDKEGAIKMAGDLLDIIRENPFKADDETPINLTASFGVATFPVDADDKNELVRLADKAMYAVKENGRNGVAGA